MDSTATTPIETKELEAKSTDLAVRAHQLVPIQDSVQYRDAIDLGRSLKAMEDGIQEFWGPLVQSAHQQHKALVKRRDDMCAPVQIAIAKIKTLIGAYDQQQERLRREQERIAQEALRREQKETAIREAQALQASGDSEGAEQVISQAAASPAPAVVIPSMVPKVTGKSSRTIWRYRVVNPELVPKEYMMVDEIKLGQIVRALKGSTRIPGIQVYEESVVSLR